MITITSKQIAEMLNKRHDNLLRAIRKYVTQLGGEADKYFIPDNDKGGKLYHITLEGCDLIAGRIIGAEGVEFKSKYSPLFEEETVEQDLTVAEVAELLGISERAVYRNIQSGKIACIEKEILIPSVKKFVTRDELERYKAEREGK